MIDKFKFQLLQLYNNDYTEVFKPLLAEVEICYEKLPAAILNEIRAFNDHISRCYWNDATEKFIKDNLDKAANHLKRAILDCFKHLNVFYFDVVKEFDKKSKNINLKIINNGEFYIEYRNQKSKAHNTLREAKRIENLDFDESFLKYQEALCFYRRLDSLINDNLHHVRWARVIFGVKRFFVKPLLWILSIVASVIIKDYFTQNHINVFSIFKK